MSNVTITDTQRRQQQARSAMRADVEQAEARARRPGQIFLGLRLAAAIMLFLTMSYVVTRFFHIYFTL